ncbi:MAG: spore coat protein [Nitrospinaceae bacterium]|nr:MAG: spore coat protein [Nitrospinaceae bacterium]
MNIDLPFHRALLDDDEINEVVDTLKSGWFTTGPKTHQFEEEFKQYIGCKHALGLNSCTAGLHLSLVVNEFAEGSEVITTPMTFPATASVAVHERLRPVFVDIEPGTLNIDVYKIEEKITSKTRAILPVHFAGHACDMDAIEDIARKHNLVIIEDAAHAVESSYKQRKIGNLGHLTSFSFYANKNITTGEGGMLTTNDDALADKIRVMRLHGLSKDAWKRFGRSGYSHWQLHAPGYKYNMPDISAALGIHQLRKVNQFYELRKRYAAMYDEAFKNVPEIKTLVTRSYAKSAYHLYIIALNLDRLTITRDQFVDEIQARGIGVGVHYVGLHLQPFYRKEFHTGPQDCPVATDYSERVLTLPLYPKMTPREVNRVIETVTDIITQSRR